MAWRAWLPEKAPRRWHALLIGTAFAGIGTLARAVLAPAVGHDLPFITFFPAIILAAVLGGGTGGMVCLLLATAAALAFFLPGNRNLAWTLGSFWVSAGFVIVVAAALADSVRALRRSRAQLHEAQTKLHTLVGELAHRNRNALAVIMSIVSQSAKRASSAADAAKIINERLHALAHAQDVVLKSQGGPVPLGEVIETVVAPFGRERFAIAPPPDAAVTADLAAPLALVLHELGTNAVKYGALSNAEGRIEVEGALDDGRVRLWWRERHGPLVTEPKEQGFGGRLFQTALAPLGGTVERRFEREGLVCDLDFPATVAED